jgi:putative spermidine/putrescine transport system permease protein
VPAWRTARPLRVRDPRRGAREKALDPGIFQPDPDDPVVVPTMTPFIEQLDRNIESAARMCGASTPQVLLRILAPLVIPGAPAAGVLVLVRTAAMFELTFLTAGPDSQTLVVALYNAAATPGERPAQLIDAMATIYMLMSFLLLALALKFVNPTQMVAKIER